MIEFDHDACAPVSDSRGSEFDQSGDSRASRDKPSGWFVAERADDQYAALARTIESEIIPRLLLAHRFDTPRPVIVSRVENSDPGGLAEDFARLVTDHDADVLYAHLASLMTRGLSLDAVFLEVLAPTARHFGERWCSDECDFVEVTLALCKLQHLLRAFGEANHDTVADARPDHGILLAAVPGAQHSFGLLMLEGFFRRAGWGVRALPMPSAGEICDAARREWYSVVGLSVGTDTQAAKVPALIARLRKISRNRAIVVLAGGPYFDGKPEQATALGADATAADAQSAVTGAERAVRTINRN
jgi:methanogenic corrinoid protein MtbC1